MMIKSLLMAAVVTATAFALQDATAPLSDEDSKAQPSDSSIIPFEGDEETTSFVNFPEGTPEWVVTGDYIEEEVEYRLVSSGPCVSRRDCERELNAAISETTQQYIADVFGTDAARHVRIESGYIRDHLLVTGEKHYLIRNYQFGPMETAYTQMKFDDAFRADVERRWVKTRARNRLVYTGVGAGAVMLFLATVFGYFRLDNATRGFYTGRLQFLAAAAILGLIVAGFVVLRGVPLL